MCYKVHQIRILYDYNSMAFCKRQTYGDSKKMRIGLVSGREEQVEDGESGRAELDLLLVIR